MEVTKNARLEEGMYLRLIPFGRKDGESKKTDAYVVGVYRHSVLVEFHHESGARERQMFTNFELYEAGVYDERDCIGLTPMDSRWLD